VIGGTRTESSVWSNCSEDASFQEPPPWMMVPSAGLWICNTETVTSGKGGTYDHAFLLSQAHGIVIILAIESTKTGAQLQKQSQPVKANSATHRESMAERISVRKLSRTRKRLCGNDSTAFPALRYDLVLKLGHERRSERVCRKDDFVGRDLPPGCGHDPGRRLPGAD
jgi:hypothetical protein